MFERYFEDESEWISIGALCGVTRKRLRLLERIYGVEWDKQARKALFGHTPSYLIEGTGPEGEEIVYETRETASRGAEQTFVWIDGRKRRLGDFELYPPFLDRFMEVTCLQHRDRKMAEAGFEKPPLDPDEGRYLDVMTKYDRLGRLVLGVLKDEVDEEWQSILQEAERKRAEYAKGWETRKLKLPSG